MTRATPAAELPSAPSLDARVALTAFMHSCQHDAQSSSPSISSVTEPKSVPTATSNIEPIDRNTGPSPFSPQQNSEQPSDLRPRPDMRDTTVVASQQLNDETLGHDALSRLLGNSGDIVDPREKMDQLLRTQALCGNKKPPAEKIIPNLESSKTTASHDTQIEEQCQPEIHLARKSHALETSWKVDDKTGGIAFKYEGSSPHFEKNRNTFDPNEVTIAKDPQTTQATTVAELLDSELLSLQLMRTIYDCYEGLARNPTSGERLAELVCERDRLIQFLVAGDIDTVVSELNLDDLAF